MCQYSTVEYSTVQLLHREHLSVQYSTVQYSTVQFLYREHLTGKVLSCPHLCVLVQGVEAEVWGLPGDDGGVVVPHHHHLYCTVLYCTVLYCTVLYCTVLYCTVLYYTVLYCTVLYCTVLYCTVLYCTVLYCPTLLSPGSRGYSAQSCRTRSSGRSRCWCLPGSGSLTRNVCGWKGRASTERGPPGPGSTARKLPETGVVSLRKAFSLKIDANRCILKYVGWSIPT